MLDGIIRYHFVPLMGVIVKPSTMEFAVDMMGVGSANIKGAVNGREKEGFVLSTRVQRLNNMLHP